MVRISALAVAPLLLYSPSAIAWGGLAHEAVCEIAFLELDDRARQRVIALIGLDEEFNSFRASCNWPDRPRQRAEEHYVNFPREAARIGDDECPMAEKCVVTAIEVDFAVLASDDATDAEKLAALKFLGHWVGDIHQPMHAGFQDDRGGNNVSTEGSSCDNLHALWDRCLVEERLGMEPVAIVGEIRASITDEQRAAWLMSDPADWANESVATAREPAVRYCVMVGEACYYEAGNREFAEGEPKKVVVVDDAYLDRYTAVARKRIAMAGVRLAGLINRALGDQAAETSLKAELLSRIDAISRELAELRATVEALGP
jgi:S1/P1 Nuclease